MPSKSKAQQRLMAAAEHGADFPMAQHLRDSMTHNQLHDFAVGSMENKPEHVTLAGDHPSIISSNVDTFKQAGQSEFDATKRAIAVAQKPRKIHENFKKFLHPRKDGKPHGSPRD